MSCICCVATRAQLADDRFQFIQYPGQKCACQQRQSFICSPLLPLHQPGARQPIIRLHSGTYAEYTVVHSLYTSLSPHFHSCRFCSFNNKVCLMFDVVQVQPIQSPRDDQSTLAPAWFTSEAGYWLQCPGCSVWRLLSAHSAAEVEAEWRRSGGG